jgi:hypothetical protein
MNDLFQLILGILASRFKSRAKLEAENLILRQQVNVLRRQVSKRPHLNNIDRLLFVWLYRWFPSILQALAIVRPETIIRWHRSGCRAYWRCGPSVYHYDEFIRETDRTNRIVAGRGSAPSHRSLSSAAFTTIIAESNFRYTQPAFPAVLVF